MAQGYKIFRKIAQEANKRLRERKQNLDNMKTTDTKVSTETLKKWIYAGWRGETILRTNGKESV
jgi:hypothetical protein